MPLFPAAKMMDMVIGIDVHPVMPLFLSVHPYFGPIYLWHTPSFPKIDVFINGMPACSVGSMGYFFHIPQGVPLPPTIPNIPYWKRYLTNIPKVLTLVTLTIAANLAIAGISAFIPKPPYAEEFIKSVTGIDTTSKATAWESIKTTFAAYTKWQTWVKLLLPPLPYPGAQGSSAVGSPNVTVNGGPLGFAAPLVGTSCSIIPVVPNACVLGFSNVMVGVSISALIMGILASTTQAAISYGLGKAVDRLPGLRGAG